MCLGGSSSVLLSEQEIIPTVPPTFIGHFFGVGSRAQFLLCSLRVLHLTTLHIPIACFMSFHLTLHAHPAPSPYQKRKRRLSAPPPGFLSFEKLPLHGTKKTPPAIVASGRETNVNQAQSEFLRISDIRSFSLPTGLLCRRPVHCTLPRPVQVAVHKPQWMSAFLSVNSGHGTQKFLAKTRYATFLKKLPIKWHCVCNFYQKNDHSGKSATR